MANENQNEQALDPRVAERLDKIDWDGLLRITGIRREQIEGNPTVARQLAYQQYTDLVYGNTADISGQFSLRAVPGREPDEAWKVKAYTIEREKTVNDDIFLYGSPITSKKAKEALFERTSWENSEGKRVVGRANANAGRPIAIERDVDGERRKDYYLVSLHEPTNRVIGIPVDAVRRMFFDENERAREVSIYGARLSAEQLDEICKGNHVLVDGCRNSKGEEFSTFVQFDVARRQLGWASTSSAPARRPRPRNPSGPGRGRSGRLRPRSRRANRGCATGADRPPPGALMTASGHGEATDPIRACGVKVRRYLR